MTKISELQKKQNRLVELTKLIELHTGQPMTHEQKQSVENETFKQEFALKNLMDEFKEREVSVKITTLENILNILKNA